MVLADSSDVVARYGAVAHITNPEGAIAHLLVCIADSRRKRPALSFADALKVERTKIGYFAGGLPYALRERVEKLFGCVHPFAGPVKPSHRERRVQLGGTFEALCQVWDTSPVTDRAFGPHRQPSWDISFCRRAQAKTGARPSRSEGPPARLRGQVVAQIAP